MEVVKTFFSRLLISLSVLAVVFLVLEVLREVAKNDA
jgi:hypothetical protein